MGSVLAATKDTLLWENGSIHDLTALILPGSDIEVFEAWDVNDRGEIAAVGMLPNGDQHAILLVPASEEEIAAANAINVSHPTSLLCALSLRTQRIQFPAVATGC